MVALWVWGRNCSNIGRSNSFWSSYFFLLNYKGENLSHSMSSDAGNFNSALYFGLKTSVLPLQITIL